MERVLKVLYKLTRQAFHKRSGTQLDGQKEPATEIDERTYERAEEFDWLQHWFLLNTLINLNKEKWRVKKKVMIYTYTHTRNL